MPESPESKIFTQWMPVIVGTLVLGMGGWGISRIIDQGEHISKIDVTLQQQTELMRDNIQFSKSASLMLGQLDPAKLESAQHELRDRLNELQRQLSNQQQEIWQNRDRADKEKAAK